MGGAEFYLLDAHEEVLVLLHVRKYLSYELLLLGLL